MWIKLEDGTYAEQNLPDPRRILTAEEMAEEAHRIEEEMAMYDQEMAHLTERKADLQTKLNEINSLIQ